VTLWRYCHLSLDLFVCLFIYLFITYYVKLRLLLFNIGFLTLLLVQTCSDVKLLVHDLGNHILRKLSSFLVMICFSSFSSNYNLKVFCNESRDIGLNVNQKLILYTLLFFLLLAVAVENLEKKVAAAITTSCYTCYICYICISLTYLCMWFAVCQRTTTDNNGRRRPSSHNYASGWRTTSCGVWTGLSLLIWKFLKPRKSFSKSSLYIFNCFDVLRPYNRITLHNRSDIHKKCSDK